MGSISLYKYIFYTTMKNHDEYDQRAKAQEIKQKLQTAIKKYTKLNKKKNSIQHQLDNISRDIKRYKLSYEEVS